MKPDLYTKAVLAVIALMLAVIACKPLINPETTASAQGPFAGVQFTSDRGASGAFFDTRTGELWLYDVGYQKEFGGKMFRKFRLTKLGQPLTKESGDFQ
jgi:hypothetical protein